VSAGTAETPPLSGTLLGFDFGEKRLGVAVGETATGLAHPVAAIAEEATEARFAAIARLVAEWHPAGFVVGLPRHPDGGEHEVVGEVRADDPSGELEGFGAVAVGDGAEDSDDEQRKPDDHPDDGCHP